MDEINVESRKSTLANHYITLEKNTSKIKKPSSHIHLKSTIPTKEHRIKIN